MFQNVCLTPFPIITAESTTDGLTQNIMVFPTGILYYEAQQYHRNDAMQFPAFY